MSAFQPVGTKAGSSRYSITYEAQSDEEAMVEDEAACESTTHTTIEVPGDLVPEVRVLMAKHKAS